LDWVTNWCVVKAGIKYEFRERLIGGAALDATGVPLPDETLSSAKQSDAVLLGAVGGYFTFFFSFFFFFKFLLLF